ncbi:MAG: hypothetical protein JO290_05305 [Sphingomonadaceae bacterium]|nr:hypothetical protein [Sphingomonadaceae bacterium]
MRLTFLAAAALIGTAAAAQSVVQRIAVPDGGWDYVSFDPTSHRVFVGRSDGVLTVDVTSGKVTPQLVAATRTHAALALGDTGLGAVTSTAAGGVILFDGATGAVKATLPTGPKPDAALFDARTKTLLVLDNKVGTVTMIDPVAAKVTGTVSTGTGGVGALESGALDGRGHLFVTVEDGGEIADIDLAAKTVARRIKLAGCDEPGGLTLTKAGVLIASCANRVAKVVDAKTGAALGDLAIGNGPDQAAYDPARDRAYIPTGRDGMVTVIDTSARMPRVIATVPGQQGARGGAVDPATGTLWTIAAKYEPAAAGQRPKAVPGSVEVIGIK